MASRRPAAARDSAAGCHRASHGGGGNANAATESTAPPLAETGPAPEGLDVAVTRTSRGFRLRATRPGYLVALIGRTASAAGDGAALLDLDFGDASIDDAARALAAGRGVIWETSAAGGRVVEHGGVDLTERDGAFEARAFLADEPKVVERWEAEHCACEAHDDPFGGFVVLCAFTHPASGVTAVNLTGHWPHEDVLVADRAAGAVVRLDLPLRGPKDTPSVASRVIAYHVMQTASLIDVDATRVPGEAAVITLGVASRTKAAPNDDFAPRPKGNNRPRAVSSRPR